MGFFRRIWAVTTWAYNFSCLASPNYLRYCYLFDGVISQNCSSVLARSGRKFWLYMKVAVYEAARQTYFGKFLLNAWQLHQLAFLWVAKTILATFCIGEDWCARIAQACLLA